MNFPSKTIKKTFKSLFLEDDRRNSVEVLKSKTSVEKYPSIPPKLQSLYHK